MSTKGNTQQGRRTPLSANVSGTKSACNKSGNNETNGHPIITKQMENKINQLKNESAIIKTIDIVSENTVEVKHKEIAKTVNGVGGKSTIIQFTKEKQPYETEKEISSGNTHIISHSVAKKEIVEQADKRSKNEKGVKNDKLIETKLTEEESNQDEKTKLIEKQTIDVVTVDSPKSMLELKNDSIIVLTNEKNDVIIDDMSRKTPNKTKDDRKLKVATIDDSLKKTSVKVKEERKSSTFSRGTRSTPSKARQEKLELKIMKSTSIPIILNGENTTIDDVTEVKPLLADSSPVKLAVDSNLDGIELSNVIPSATSTPGKVVFKKNAIAPTLEIQKGLQLEIPLDRSHNLSQISGRRSIRPMTDYIPSTYLNDISYKQSYRGINSELDVTSTSLNVTIGSEALNNSSFSLFERSRKRERAMSKSNIETDNMDIIASPPKRARLDFFSVVCSPITMLRNRFTRTLSLQNAPKSKEQSKKQQSYDDEIGVQNLSGVSEDEVDNIPSNNKENISINDVVLGNSSKDISLQNIDLEQKQHNKIDLKVHSEVKTSCTLDNTINELEIQTQQTEITVENAGDNGQKIAKKSGCVIM